jgi:hypothetical protein
MKKKLSPHPITNAKKQAKTVEESKTEADSAAATSRPMVEPAQLKEFQKDFEIARLSSDAAKYYLRAETNHVASGRAMRRTWRGVVECGASLRRMKTSGSYLDKYDNWGQVLGALRIPKTSDDRMMECAEKLPNVEPSIIGAIAAPLSGKGVDPEQNPHQKDVDWDIVEAEMPKQHKSRNEAKEPTPQARPRPKSGGAEAFLRTRLAGGRQVPATAIIEEAAAAGISMRTLNRAKDRLGVRSDRVGFGPGGHVVWTLPVENP